jgi:hemolysin activation/secretion protein
VGKIPPTPIVGGRLVGVCMIVAFMFAGPALGDPAPEGASETAPVAGQPSSGPSQSATAAAQPASTPSQTVSPSSERHVDIEAYDVDGNTKLDQETIETAVYPFLGPDRVRDDVGAARQALQRAYESHGYQSVVVEIPPQNVTNGIVKLHVVEAPVGRLRVTGARYYLPSEIKAHVPSLKAGNVPNFEDTQQELADLNRLPGEQVTPLLKPGKVPDTVDVDLQVKDQLPVHASVELNNDHSANTEPLRTIATVRYDNLWQLGNSISATWLRAPQNVKSGQVFAASYLAPIWGSPWSLLVSGYQSNSLVNTLGGTGVLGNGYSISAHGVLTLPKLGGFDDTFNFGISFNHFLENVGFNPNAPCVSPIIPGGTCTTIEYVPLVATYDVSRASKESATDISIGVTVGIRGSGTSPLEYEQTRAFATGNFVHVNLDATQTQSLGDDFQAVFHFAGQGSDQPLVPTEEYALGGLASVRGYLQSEAVADNGLLGSIELRSPSIGSWFGSFIDDWRFFAFGDSGMDWVEDPLPAVVLGQPNQKSAYHLYSAGLGSRIQLFTYVSGNVDVAVPLINGPTTKAYQPVTSFSVKTEF